MATGLRKRTKKQTRMGATEMDGLPESYVQLLKESYERLLKEKDERLKEKDEGFARLQKEKDKVLHLKDQLLLAKDKALLQTHGLFTARGVFEHFVKLAHSELYSSGDMGPRFTVGETLDSLDHWKQWFDDNSDNTHRWCRSILKAHKNCQAKLEHREGKTLKEIYGVLSHSIHGFPWHGECLRLDSSLDPCSKCVIVSLADEAGWCSECKDSCKLSDAAEKNKKKKRKELEKEQETEEKENRKKKKKAIRS